MCAGFPSISSNAAMRSASTARLNVPYARPVRRAAIAAEIGRNHPKSDEAPQPQSAHWRPESARAMQQHDRLANAGGEVLDTDAAGIDGCTADALLLEGHHAAFNDLVAASRPCLMSATMSSICSMPTDRRT